MINISKKNVYCICLFGPDGGGKTTIAKIISNHLTSRGIKVRIVWMRGTHLFARFIAGFFSKYKIFAGSDNPFFEINIPPSLKRIWQLIEFFSFLPIFFLRYTLPRAFGYFVIADRFLIDFVVWVSLTTSSPDYIEIFESRFLLTLNRRLSTNFFITADELQLIKRKNDMSAEFINKQNKLYTKLAIYINADTIDTTNLLPHQISLSIIKRIL